jgi:hypothetical protein
MPFADTSRAWGGQRREGELMDGPEILTRSMTATKISDQFGNQWQYHPRSDRHSKVACWAAFYDLLNTSSLLRMHVADGKVIIGVNHTMQDFKTRRKKELDLVIAWCTAGTTEAESRSSGMLPLQFRPTTFPTTR